jgi:transcriptional regulator GlxA family with amidase domain
VARVCRQHLGKTPTEVVNESRLEWAAQRLAQTAVPIEVIAEECGMANVSYFYKRFALQNGMTPGEYRKSALRIAGSGAG